MASVTSSKVVGGHSVCVRRRHLDEVVVSRRTSQFDPRFRIFQLYRVLMIFFGMFGVFVQFQESAEPADDREVLVST